MISAAEFLHTNKGKPFYLLNTYDTDFVLRCDSWGNWFAKKRGEKGEYPQQRGASSMVDNALFDIQEITENEYNTY